MEKVEWCTVAESGEVLRRSACTVRQYLKSGLLKGHRPGGRRILIDRRQLDALVLNSTPTTPEPQK